jgi:hopene-associated glycosyltransferase HpnB
MLLLDRTRRWPGELFLDRLAVSTEASVVALVPARDEAAVLPATLPALFAQEHGALRILLVDDGSTDGTPEVALALAQSSGAADRCRVLKAPARPVGWVGKVWAQQSGWQSILADEQQPSEWVLLTDADIRHAPHSVRSLLGKACRGGYDVVSVMARLHTRTCWERLVIPAFVFFFQLLYPFRSVRRRSSQVAAAAGACVLVRRAALDRIGGFEAIRDAVIDDVVLARELADGGARLWLGFDEDIVSVRPYKGLKELWDMVARSAFTQLRFHYWLVALVVLGLVVLFVSPPVLAALAGTRLLKDTPVDGWALRALVCALGAWAVQARLLHPFVRHHRVPAIYSLSLPFASLLYAGMTASSAWRHRRGQATAWKGRSYEAPGE